jgi:hypothetical protein
MEKRKRGRPAVLKHERAENVTVRMYAEDREAFRALGGSRWLRLKLRRAAKKLVKP